MNAGSIPPVVANEHNEGHATMNQRDDETNAAGKTNARLYNLGLLVCTGTMLSALLIGGFAILLGPSPLFFWLAAAAGCVGVTGICMVGIGHMLRKNTIIKR
jgi:hypothetical protein